MVTMILSSKKLMPYARAFLANGRQLLKPAALATDEVDLIFFSHRRNSSGSSGTSIKGFPSPIFFRTASIRASNAASDVKSTTRTGSLAK